MSGEVSIGILFLVGLVAVHLVREAFRATNRAYLHWLLEGQLDTLQGRFPPVEYQTRGVVTLRFGRTLMVAGWGLYVALILLRHAPRWEYWLGGLVLVGGVDELARLVGQWVNSRWERVRDVLVRHSTWLINALTPVAWGARLLGRYLFGTRLDWDVVMPVSEDQVIIMAHQEGDQPMLAKEKELIDNIIDFRETIVREIMVPRLDIVAVEANTSLQKALDVIIEHGHSRIPVYEENIDQMIGILYAKDILRYVREALPGWPTVSLREMMRRPYFVPDSKRVSALLPEMQQNKVHLAIVVDEYGGTAGIVTIEDVLEEIVGEIQDEYDRETPQMQQVGEYEYLINARADIEDVSDFIGVPLPEDEADTLGGFIYSRLKTMPKVGDEVAYPPVRMRVLSVDGRRIGQVYVVVESREVSASEPSDGRQSQVGYHVQ